MNPFRSLIKVKKDIVTTPKTYGFRENARCIACNELYLGREPWCSKLCNGKGTRFGLWPFRYLFGRRCYAKTWEHIHMKCNKCGCQWLMRSLRAEHCLINSKNTTNYSIDNNGNYELLKFPRELLDVPIGALDNVR